MYTITSKKGKRERNPEMMYIPDFKNAINDYLTNSGQNPDDWDVDGAAVEMRCSYDVDSIDDIPADEFTDILVRFSK